MWPRAHTVTISPCTRYMNFRRACHQDIKYHKDRHRSFTFWSSYGALQIWQFTLWIKTDCSIFAERRSLLDYIYEDDNDKVICLFWTNRRNRLETFLLDRRQRSKTFDRLVERNSLHQTLSFYNPWTLSYEISKMTDILNIGGESIFDNRIVRIETRVWI